MAVAMRRCRCQWVSHALHSAVAETLPEGADDVRCWRRSQC